MKDSSFRSLWYHCHQYYRQARRQKQIITEQDSMFMIGFLEINHGERIAQALSICFEGKWLYWLKAS